MEAGNRAVSTLELTRLAELHYRPVTWFLSQQDIESQDAFVTLHRAAIGLEGAPESKTPSGSLCGAVPGGDRPGRAARPWIAARPADLFRGDAADPLGCHHPGAARGGRRTLPAYEEIKAGTDDWQTWIKEDEVKSALLLAEDAHVSLVAQVTDRGYAADLTDIEIEKIGRDPFLVAYGLADVGQRVVTTEASKPRTQRANRRVPDVCDQFGIPWCNTFAFLRRLSFSTGWKSS